MSEATAATRRSAGDEDLLLVDRILAGDTQAFEELVRLHERRAYRTALAVTGNAEDAEEATQDTFFKVYRHLHEFQRASRFTTWLTRIAVNEGLQILRRRRPMDSLDDPGLPGELMLPRRFEEWHEDPERRYATQEIRQFVEEAVASLPPTYRVVFVLRDVEGLSTEEAAEVLNVGTPALKSRLLRARLMVREALAARFERPANLRTHFRRAGMMLRATISARFRHRSSPRQET